jgi:hypothetical protein
MAGMFVEVMEGIAAKEKENPHAETGKAGEEKPMNSYSDDFKTKYGERVGKKPA